MAYLAKFYYAPESNTPDWVFVTAHINFHHGYGNPGMYKAFRPVWFETETNKQIFRRAETHELIMIMGGEQQVAPYESTDKEGKFHCPGVYEYEFPAEVELMIERDQYVTKQTFNYQLTGKRKPNDLIVLREV